MLLPQKIWTFLLNLLAGGAARALFCTRPPRTVLHPPAPSLPRQALFRKDASLSSWRERSDRVPDLVGAFGSSARRDE